jgi:hypothetical protein
MLWWIVPLALFVLLLGYLLFARLFIGIDSTTGHAGMKFGKLAEATVVLNGDVQVVQVKVGWWKKEFDLFRRSERAGTAKAKPVRAAKKQGKPVPVKRVLRKIRAVVASFHITRCRISIDTGNMPLNGVLYPWFLLLRRRAGKNISINFWGENTVILEAENSIARMLWAYIKS